MAGTIDIEPKDNTRSARKLYKGNKATLMCMEPVPEKVASGLKNNDTKNDMVTVVAHFIKENSGEYKRSSMWSRFSNIMTLKEFNGIIEELHRSGKIAIDNEDKIGWIWNPKLTEKYRSRTDLSFR